MKVNKDNIYPGAKVKKEGEELTVIKVNEKSFYVGKISWQEYQKEWERRIKGTTFKDFCKMYSIRMVRYVDGFEIEESEVVKKEAITSNSYKIEPKYSLVLQDNIAYYKKKGKQLKLETFHCDGGFIRVLEEKDGCYLLNIDNSYILHCAETGESCLLGGILEYNYPEIPWNKLSKFSCISA